MLKERIKELCAQRNITIQRLEEEAGIGNATITRWDKVSPKADSLEKVANYFGVPIDYLLGRIDTLEPTMEDVVKLFPGGKFDLQLFSDKGPMPPDDETIQKAVAVLKAMDENKRKTALAQLEALAALNRK